MGKDNKAQERTTKIMAFDFTSVNKGQKIFDFQLSKDAPYRKLQDEKPGSVYIVAGFFISKSKNPKFEDHPVAIVKDIKLEAGGFYIDLPSHLTDSVKQIMADADAVAEVNAGHCGIRITEYDNDMGHFNGIEFINIK